MKLVANEYEEKEVFKILREWTGLTQEELGNQMGKKGRSWAKGIETGKNRFFYQDLMKICNDYNIKVTFEKK